MINEIRLPRFNDMHAHLREGPQLRTIARIMAEYGDTVVCMPNTHVPVDAPQKAHAYEMEISRELRTTSCRPFMTLKLTQNTTAEDVRAAHKAGIRAYKMYPSADPERLKTLTGPYVTPLVKLVRETRGGVTTNAHNGVYDLLRMSDVLEEMSSCDMILMLHLENPYSFGLDRERDALPLLCDLSRRFPRLRFVLEHVTTRAGIECVKALGPNVSATVTFHHLLLTHDDVVSAYLQPHHHNMPTPKTDDDRRALVDVVFFERHHRFIYGSDTAGHLRVQKQADQCCAGVFSAPTAPAGLVQFASELEQVGALEDFTSGFARDRYGLPSSSGEIVMTRRPWVVPSDYGGSIEPHHAMVPFLAGKTLEWQLATV